MNLKALFLAAVFLAAFSLCTLAQQDATSSAKAHTSDLQALRDLYQATNGADWIYNTNWLNNSAVLWYGIRVQDRQVIAINLPHNNLSGSLPQSITQLERLDTLNLEGNRLTDLPVFSPWAAKRMVFNIRNNQLDFGDLEKLYLRPGKPLFKTLICEQQAALGTAQTIQVEEKEPIVLSLSSNGLFSKYQWEKLVDNEWREVKRAKMPFLTIPFSAMSDEGKYRCVVTNHWVKDIVLVSNIFTVVVSKPGNMVPDRIEYYALRSFYDRANGKAWLAQSQWLKGESAADMGKWMGIGLNGQDVGTIELPNNNLYGSLALSLADLKQLEVLNVANNKLSGVVPALLFPNTNLRLLDIRNNAFRGITGVLASGQLQSLELYLDNNNFNFGDLESLFDFQGVAKVKTLSIGNQAPLTNDEAFDVREDRSFSLTCLTPGFFNRYQWQKNTNGQWTNIEGATKAIFLNFKCEVADRGTYRCLVTNARVRNVALTSGVFTVNVLQVNNFVPDSLEVAALRDFYTQTGGSGWINNSHWLQGASSSDFSRWFGIGIYKDDVSHIILPNNRLKGQLPHTFGQLKSLIHLHLNNNQLNGSLPVGLAECEKLRLLDVRQNNLTGLPDFSAHSAVDELIVMADGNNLDFGDLEPLFMSNGKSVLKYLSYSQQAEIGQEQEILVYQLNPLNLSVATDGSRNRYQWQKRIESDSHSENRGWVGKIHDRPYSKEYQWVDLEKGNQASFSIDSVSEADAGLYRCLVTNYLVPNLVLTSKTITVKVEKNWDVRFTLDTRGYASKYQYAIMATNLNDTVSFGSVREFVIPRAIGTTSVLMNVMDASGSVGYGYKFLVGADGVISRFAMVKGMTEVAVSESLFDVTGSTLVLRSPAWFEREWPAFSLALQYGYMLTPNGDGVFDTLVANGVSAATDFYLEIKDQLGQVVFKSSNVNMNWDCINATTGAIVPNGVYFYSLSALGQTIKGQMVVSY